MLDFSCWPGSLRDIRAMVRPITISQHLQAKRSIIMGSVFGGFFEGSKRAVHGCSVANGSLMLIFKSANPLAAIIARGLDGLGGRNKNDNFEPGWGLRGA